MNSGIEITGMDDFKRELDKMAEESEKLNGTYVTFEELFPKYFMKRHSDFETFNELLDAGGYNVETQEEFEALPQEEWNDYIKKVTDFTDWQEMLTEAGTRYAGRRLGLE